MSSPTITPYRTSIPDSSLSLLTTKLATTTFPPETTFTDNWDYGASLTSLKRLVSYWKNGFDWRTQEKMLNEKLPQFMTTVEVEGFGELEIHFVHQKSEERESIPLLFCHGWPGSFLEVIKILPLLTRKDGDGPSFHVVAPSLPNFGFSEGPKKPGFGIPQYAEAMHKVMLNLGYDKYVTQGGDWGFEITRTIGIKYPHHCLASHLNYIEIPPLYSPHPNHPVLPLFPQPRRKSRPRTHKLVPNPRLRLQHPAIHPATHARLPFV
ncbi:hypothetical protein G7Y89_g1704 [Cudoniella acicularis]|uniref:Epoxide hydrolase N-terminal domain-containing protein n=1 Tax=Cudoniella acicularis TaxID=354080 RepID=A0A8H4RVV2_9HELO|nr:hypothetical protein G7Y89_g1704 [Cudoniella acicularis]